MDTYSVTLVLDVPDLEAFADWFYASYDGLVSAHDGLVVAEAEVPGAKTALSAGQQLVRALEQYPALRVCGVDLDLVNTSEIADRMGVSRQYIAQLVSRPGSTPFPRPLGVAGRVKIWDWGSVNEWLRATGRDETDPEIHLTYADACELEAWLRTRGKDAAAAWGSRVLTKGGSLLIGHDVVKGSFERRTPLTAASVADEITEYLKTQV